MRIESLELFIAVAQSGSVSAAAQRRFISQQGASKAIRSLEQELKCTLFERTHGGLQLTPLGERILPEAITAVEAHRRMLSIAAASESIAATEQLEIMTTPFITNQLTSLFASYESLMPHVRLRIIERSPFKIVQEYYDGSPQSSRSGQLGGPQSSGPELGDPIPSDPIPSDPEPSVATDADANRKDAGLVRLIAVPFFMERMAQRMSGDFVPLVVSELVASAAAAGALDGRESVSAQELCNLPLAYYNEEFLNRLVKHLFSGLRPDIRIRTSNLDMLASAIGTEGMVTFSDSLSVYLHANESHATFVPIVDSVPFVVGMLGKPADNTEAARFLSFAQRFFSITCAPYMQHYRTLPGNPFGEAVPADPPDSNT